MILQVASSSAVHFRNWFPFSRSFFLSIVLLGITDWLVVILIRLIFYRSWIKWGRRPLDSILLVRFWRAQLMQYFYSISLLFFFLAFHDQQMRRNRMEMLKFVRIYHSVWPMKMKQTATNKQLLATKPLFKLHECYQCNSDSLQFTTKYARLDHYLFFLPIAANKSSSF